METIHFKLETDFIELCHLLKITGVVQSGGEAKHAILSGLVFVNENVETRKKCKIFSGQTVHYQSFLIHVS